MSGVYEAQKKLVDILRSEVLDVPNVYLGAIPYPAEPNKTRYPYLAIQAITGESRVLKTRTSVLRVIYGLVCEQKQGLADERQQMGEWLVTLAEKAMAAIESRAGSLEYSRVTRVGWLQESRITGPYWHLLLDFTVEFHSRPAFSGGFLT